MAASTTRVLGNLALSIVTLVIALALGETVVRLFYKDEAGLFPRYHTDYQYGTYLIRGIRPNSEFWHTSVDGSWKYVTNGKGFRNVVDFSYDKPQGTYRVLSLGDSHTQGYEVRQDSTFTAVLERSLATRHTKVEAINAGVSGFSTAEALVFLENEGVSYHPDAVVLGFYANDFEDNLKAGLFSLDDQEKLIEIKREHIPGVRLQNFIYNVPPLRWLSENSYFYSLLFNTVWKYFKYRLRQEAAKTDPKLQSSVSRHDDFEYAIPATTRLTEYQIALAASLIERMHRFCEARGIRLIVVDIPVGLEPYRFVSSFPPQLAARLRAGGIEYLDSESLYAGFDGVAEIHLPHGQRHISEIAHTLIAVSVGRSLRSSRAFPRPK